MREEGWEADLVEIGGMGGRGVEEREGGEKEKGEGEEESGEELERRGVGGR